MSNKQRDREALFLKMSLEEKLLVLAKLDFLLENPDFMERLLQSARKRKAEESAIYVDPEVWDLSDLNI